MRIDVFRILLERLKIQAPSFVIVLFRVTQEEMPRLEEQLIGFRIISSLSTERALLRSRQTEPQLSGYFRRNLVLYAEQVC